MSVARNPRCVCIFSNFYPPVVSGSSVQVEGLCRELVRNGWEVVVITARVAEGGADHEIIDGIHVYRLPAVRLPRALTLGFDFPWLSFTFSAANLGRVREIVARHAPGVLHLHNYMFDLALSAEWMRRSFRLPLVLTIHTYLRHPSFLVNAAFYLVEQLFLRWAVVRGAACVICPDMNVAAYARREFGRVRTALVPYGIRLSSSQPGTASELQQRFGLQGKRVILSVGHLHAMRDRKDLILAMPRVLQVLPDALLLVVGDESIEWPRALAEQHGVGHAVRFAGPLPHREVSSLYAIADLEAHWLNQDKPENTSLGIASLEAMSAGMTVLAAANPDTYGKGVLASGSNIMIVAPQQPEALALTIVELLQDDARRKAIGARARQTVLEHFSWDSVGRQTIGVYESVLAPADRTAKGAAA